MDLVSRVSQNFHDNISATQIALEVMSEPLVSAAEVMTQCLLEGGKILTCGNAGASLTAQYLAAIMLNRLQLPRPGLPAICLSSSSAVLTCIAHDHGHQQMFANQVSALGQQSDVLFTICNESDDEAVLAAAKTAHDRDMRVISLTGESGDELSAILTPADIEITVPADNNLRTHELQILAVHVVCDLIDTQLLGQ